MITNGNVSPNSSIPQEYALHTHHPLLDPLNCASCIYDNPLDACPVGMENLCSCPGCWPSISGTSCITSQNAWPGRWPSGRLTEVPNIKMSPNISVSLLQEYSLKIQDSGGFTNDHMILTVVFFHQFLCLWKNQHFRWAFLEICSRHSESWGVGLFDPVDGCKISHEL